MNTDNKTYYGKVTLVSAAGHAALKEKVYQHQQNSVWQNFKKGTLQKQFKAILLVHYSLCKQTEILSYCTVSKHPKNLSNCVFSGQNSRSWVRSWKCCVLTNYLHQQSLQQDFRRVIFLSPQQRSCFNTCIQPVLNRSKSLMPW